jgi:hypothetical protein
MLYRSGQQLHVCVGVGGRVRCMCRTPGLLCEAGGSVLRALFDIQRALLDPVAEEPVLFPRCTPRCQPVQVPTAFECLFTHPDSPPLPV